MFLLLCGKLPFDGDDHNEIIRSTIQVWMRFGFVWLFDVFVAFVYGIKCVVIGFSHSQMFEMLAGDTILFSFADVSMLNGPQFDVSHTHLFAHLFPSPSSGGPEGKSRGVGQAERGRQEPHHLAAQQESQVSDVCYVIFLNDAVLEKCEILLNE